MTWPTKTDFVDGDVLNASQMNNIGTNLNLADPTGITDGYVLTADGADSMGWEAVSAGGMTLLATVSLSNVASGTASGLDLSPYRLAYISYKTEDAADNAGLTLRFNSTSTSTYTYAIAYDTSQQGGEDTTGIRIAANYYSTVQGGVWVDVRTGGTFRTCSFWAYTNRRTNADDRPWATFGSGGWESTNAITAFTIVKVSGSFTSNANNQFLVYGVK